MAHTGDLVGLGGTAERETGRDPAPQQRAEARSGDLTIELSVLPPRTGTATAFDAQLRSQGAPEELADIDVWLRIRPRDGGVDQLVMQRVPSHAKAWYHAEYRFPAGGVYLVTAEARPHVGADVLMVSVTTELDVQNGSHRDRRDWLVPVAILGGLGTVVWMTLMMGGPWF